MTLQTGRLALHQAIVNRAQHETKRGSSTRRGTVVHTSPLQIKLFGFAPILTVDEHFSMTQWMMLYQNKIGFHKDDVVLVHADDEMVLFDVITDTPITPLT